MLPFRIKICGLTEEEDACLVATSGVQCIGLNFSSHSKRQVAVDVAANIADTFRNSVSDRLGGQNATVVGVFVEQTVAEANRIADEVGLDFIQLHGDHELAVLGQAQRPVILVRRLKAKDSAELKRRCLDLLNEILLWQNHVESNGAERLAGLLLDAHVEGEWGGTGQTLAWTALKDRRAWTNDQGQRLWPATLPLVLAGGITPVNVAQALREAQPEAIDIASGVESRPGKKSATLVEELVREAGEFRT